MGTKSKKEAKRLRELNDVEWSARFDAAGSNPPSNNHEKVELTDREISTLVRRYVERKDEKFRDWFVNDAPGQAERDDLINEAGLELSILKNPDDPRADQWFGSEGDELLGEVSLDADAIPRKTRALFFEMVRRALLELTQRKLAVYEDRHDQSYFDTEFDPDRPPPVTFGELADQYLDIKIEDAKVNNNTTRAIDRIGYQVAFVRELVSDDTLVAQINYDFCLRVRSLLAQTPSNRTKLYPGLPLKAAVKKAEKEGKPLLSATTQADYLNTFRDILELATHKQLLQGNPATKLRPVKKDKVNAANKRLPFGLDQIKMFFDSVFYKDCAPGAPQPYSKPDRHWRFWMPLLTLFMGMRPREICQMLPSDVKQTMAGTWYVDIVASDDNEDEPGSSAKSKQLKTATSRRKIPIHPELIELGFIEFVQSRMKATAVRLFDAIKPDKYGNLAKYPLRRFGETFLSAAITVKPRQTYYSFRPSFRDALGRSKATPDVLKALGGWSQGNLVSDDYGDKSNPDLYVAAMAKVEYPGLDLSYLHQTPTKANM